MTTYSYAQLEQLWINAGGPRTLAPLAAAIAMAESQGDDKAVNPNDNGGTQTSWGLWQISNGTHNQPVPNILNPAVNAQQAVAKWRGAGEKFTPWGTYDSGAYQKYLSNSTTPDTNVPGGGATLAATTAATGSQTPGCLWSIQTPWSSAGSELGGVWGAIGAAGGQGAAGLAGPVSGGGGRICLFSVGEARAITGGLLMLAGGLLAVPGVLILVAFTFRATGGLGKAATIAAAVPGGQPVAAGLQAAQNRAGRTGAQALTARRASTP